MMLTLPTRNGWIVSWFTGETCTTRNGNIRRKTKDFMSTSKDEVEAKAKELKEQGFEIEYISECIF